MRVFPCSFLFFVVVRARDNPMLVHVSSFLSIFSFFAVCVCPPLAQVAQYLVDKKWTTPSLMSCEGRSAGGLLMGAVLNERPDLFRAAVAGVPFVDVCNSMCDSSIPLTTGTPIHASHTRRGQASASPRWVPRFGKKH